MLGFARNRVSSIPVPFMNETTRQQEKPRPAHVVLIHGLGGSPIVLRPLAYRIRRCGYTTSTFGYSSWRKSIEHHATSFRRHLDRIESDSAIDRFHIVAHSMGSIVTRQALLDSPASKLGRIVMLGAPNQGSPVARLLGNVLPFCKTLRQISNHPSSFVRNLPEPQSVEIGIVAARHDRVIPENNSHLSTESDHVVLFSGHNGLLVRPAAARQVVSYLNNGHFQTANRTAESI